MTDRDESSVSGMPFRIDRILVVAETLDRIRDNERLAALLRSLPSRRLHLTLCVRENTGADDLREAVRQILERLPPADMLRRFLDVRLAAPSESPDALLETHQALVTGDTPEDKALIVRAWQRGLCVVNSADQAERIAGFEDEYFDEGANAAGARPWYSVMEGNPVIVTNPQYIVLEYGTRINPRAVIHNEAEIRIGRGSLLGADAELNLYYARLTIGQFCHTSSYFGAIGSRHTLGHPTTFAVSRGPYAFLGEPADKVADIALGNDVWIGARVIVLPGVQIADGSVVGAGSVITKSLTEPYGIYAGNPARLISFRFPPHVIKWLCGTQWWNWPTRKLWGARRFFRTNIADKSEEQLWQLIES